MRRHFTFLLALILVLCGAVIPVQAEDGQTELALQDLNYTELIGRVNQIDSGFTRSSRYIYSSNTNAWAAPRNDSNFQFYYFGLERWSTDAGGKDGPIEDAFLEFVDGTLSNLRKNGGACIIRASYALDGAREAEPQEFETLLQHQTQLAQVFANYPDLIVGVECGFIGAFGEMWGGKYSAADYKEQVLHGWLTQLPETVAVNVRTVEEYVDYVNHSTLFREKYQNKIVGGIQYPVEFTAENYYRYAFEGEPFSRIGCYNDAMIQDGNDGGTFGGKREHFIAWMNLRGNTTAYGGEFSGADGEFRYHRENWLPLKAIPEFYKARFTYYHGGNAAYENTGKFRPASSYTKTYETEEQAIADEVWFLTNFEAYASGMEYSCERNGNTVTYQMGGWQSAVVSEELIAAIGEQIDLSADLSAYVGRSVSDFFESHLGYRLVLRESYLSDSVDRGGVLSLQGKIDNTGFSNMIMDKVAEIVLTGGGETYTIRTDIDPKDWVGGSRNAYSAQLKLPASIPAGEYAVYLRVAGVDPDGNTNAGGVRFANPGSYAYQVPGSDYSVGSATLKINYHSKVDGNYLGSFTVTEREVPGADDSMGQLCEVAFCAEDGRELAGDTVLSGSAVKAPVAPKKPATECVEYAFDGWVDENGMAVDMNCITRNMTVYAHYLETGEHTHPGEWTVEQMPDVGQPGAKAVYCTVCEERLDYCDIDALDAPGFPDVAKDSWYYTAVAYAISNDLFNGLSVARFAPEMEMNRGMLVSVLYRAEGSPDVTELQNPFEDVSEGRYYYDAVKWAAKEGVVTGKSAVSFAPNDKITREQMAAILYRYSVQKGYDMSVDGTLSVFPDAAKVSSYAKDAMLWANAKGLITGTKSGGELILNPKGGATRAQVATILMRYRLRF